MSEKKSTGAPDELGGIKINWHDDNMASHYANIGTATANREEFFLLFGTHQHWRGDVSETKSVDVNLAHRIVMSPFAAKRLAIILNQSVKAYEDQFGKIGS
jgi:hypothetical protein